MSTVTARYRLVGKGGLLSIQRGFTVAIRCKDVREVYGRIDVLVEPIQGVGEIWVSETRIAWES